MTYTEAFVAEVRNRISLVDLVQELAELAPAPGAMRGACPSHRDPERGLYVHNVLQRYHCFSCGESGDAVEWTMRRHGLSKDEAIGILAARTSMER